MGPDEEPGKVEVDGMELHLDPAPDTDVKPHTALPPRFEAWRRRSVAGAILTGIGLGLKEALEPKRDEPAIMIETSGDPPGDLPVEADMAGILPADKVVRIRPWLLSQTAGTAGDATPQLGESARGPAGEPRPPAAAHGSTPPEAGDAANGSNGHPGVAANGSDGPDGHPGDAGNGSDGRDGHPGDIP